MVLFCTILMHTLAQNTSNIVSGEKKSFAATINIKTPQYSGNINDTLLTVFIANEIRSGKVTAFADPECSQILSISKFNQIISTKGFVDTITYSKSDGGEVEMMVNREFNFFKIISYKIIANEAPNSGMGSAGWMPISIAPARSRVIENAKDLSLISFKGVEALFWMHYKDIKPILDKYDMKHPENKFSTQLKSIK